MSEQNPPIITYAKTDAPNRHHSDADAGRLRVDADEGCAARLRICALIPAYNEAERIGATVRSLKNRSEIDHVIVINDGSTDDTANVAVRAGADAVTSQSNSGKGAALSAGYRQAREAADVFLLLDADLGITAGEAIKLLPPILNDEADMVVGLLPPDPEFVQSGESGGGGLVVGLANGGIQRATGKTFKQPLCGQRAVRREVLDALQAASGRARKSDGDNVFAGGFGVEVGLTIAALRAGFRVVEVDTQFRHKVTGSDWSGLIHRARQYMDVARTLRQLG